MIGLSRALSLPMGQAMPRMRANLPQVRLHRERWTESRKRFKKVRQIGQGSFGKAFAGVLGKEKVIVKQAFGVPGAVSMQEAFETLKREIIILGRLQKFPFVPRLVEIGPDYFVQEDVGGEAMIRILAKGGLEAREILSTVIATGTIASMIHREGIAHRDLEPRNILLTPNGVVVIDFGISILKEREPKEWKEGIKEDVTSLLNVVGLAAAARDVPPGARRVLGGIIENFRGKLTLDQQDESTAQDLSRELFFVTAQLGARHERGKKLRREKVKVAVLK